MLLFLFVGGGKIIGAGPTKREFTELGYAQWVRVVAGVLELLGALLLLAGLFVPITTFFGAVLLVVPILISVVPRIRQRQVGALLPSTMLLLVVLIAWQQPLGLQIVMLPCQADAPDQRLPSWTVEAHPYGSFLESVQGDPGGNIYYTKTTDMDFGAGSIEEAMARARGTIMQLTPAGQSTVLAALPVGTVAGVVEWTAEGLYFTAAGQPEPTGLWRVNETTNEAGAFTDTFSRIERKKS